MRGTIRKWDRQLAGRLPSYVYFLWISGGNGKDFRTINGFRGERMKGVIGEVFSGVVEYLVAEGYVKLEDIFVDGSKSEADANKHKLQNCPCTISFCQVTENTSISYYTGLSSLWTGAAREHLIHHHVVRNIKSTNHEKAE